MCMPSCQREATKAKPVDETRCCYYCGYQGGPEEVIHGEYYDKDRECDVYNGWVCKDMTACLGREWGKEDE